MRKFYYLLTFTALLLSACNSETNDVPVINGEVLRIAQVRTDASEEAANEVEKIGKEGMRIMEYNASELLQQSVWKKSGGQWAPEKEIKPVDGGHIVAVYPAGEAQTGNERVFKAGVNNMIGLADINRKTDNTADIKLKHQMCQVELRVKDKKGREINQGDDKGHIKSATLAQPADMIFDINEGALKSIGDMQDMAFNLTANNYIVPGGKDYLLTAIYINSEGEEIGYSYKPDMTFVKNNKYVISLTMDTEDKDAQLEVSVSVEEWAVEEFEGSFIKEGPISFDWAEIPAGEFMMGSAKGGKSWERPVHKVVISKPFRMSRYEVTFDQYDEFCEKTGRTKPDDKGWGRGNRPVICVDWNDAVAFCEWAEVRLPTEAEWEYACRAGTTSIYYWGNSIDDNYCWHYDNSYKKTHPVGEKLPNAWGLYDMAGNVLEWCFDWYDYYPDKEVVDPRGPETGNYRVYRSGCYVHKYANCRSAYRNCSTETIKRDYLGFRVCKDL